MMTMDDIAHFSVRWVLETKFSLQHQTISYKKTHQQMGYSNAS